MNQKVFKAVILFLALQCCSEISSMSFINTVKGIGGSIEDWGKKFASKSFWQKIGMGFGASPSGYVYSYTVQNDATDPIFVGIQEMASAMGACFPKADGSSSSKVLPLAQHVVHNKEYYFEMTINPETKKPGYHFPYDSSGVLYVQDCIQLPKDKHSTKMNYFRSYVGKVLRDGHYVHEVQAEYLGYADPHNPKDKEASVKLSDNISSFVLHNSSSTDYFVGYSSQRGLSFMSKKDCDVFFAPVEKNSFALFTPSKTNPLPVGSVGLFSKDGGQAFEVMTLPQKVFKGKKYTLEIYQDFGQSVKMGLQGLMPGHYDVALGKVKDITPVTGMLWYQDITQLPKKNPSLFNLPGQLWIVFKGGDVSMVEQVELGTTLEFRFLRPKPGLKQWVYFVYVSSNDAKDVEPFIQKVADGSIGDDVIRAYHTQSKKQVDLAHKQLTKTLNLQSKDQQSASAVPESLLIEAVQGALQMHQGKIVDKDLGVAGYLVGADLFLSQGVSANAPFYYQLAPSMKTGKSVPTASVENFYAYSLGTGKPPKGMPSPNKVVGIPKRVLPKIPPKKKEDQDKLKAKESLKQKVQGVFKRQKKESVTLDSKSVAQS